MRWSCRRKGRPEVWTAVMWTRRGPETTTASPGVGTVTLVVRREGVSHDELATVRPNYRLCQCGGGHRGGLRDDRPLRHRLRGGLRVRTSEALPGGVALAGHGPWRRSDRAPDVGPVQDALPLRLRGSTQIPACLAGIRELPIEPDRELQAR